MTEKKRAPKKKPTAAQRAAKAAKAKEKREEAKFMAAWKPTGRAIDELPTAKMRKFVQEYLVDLNATGAARRAGYSANTASEMGYENLRKPQIARAIDEELAADPGITRTRIVDEMAKIAFSNMADYIRVDGDGDAILDLTQANREQLGVIAEASTESITKPGDGKKKPSRTVIKSKVKLYDKLAALDKLARATGAYNDSLELKGSITVIEKEDALL